MPVIFVHHELDEKPQTGGKAKQQYVRTCVQQAKKYNKEVILFGDESNQHYCDKWVDVSHFSSSKWEEFLTVFENFSTYPDTWARGIFKRFFIFEEYMKNNDIGDCIILDSDVLVWCDFDQMGYLREYDAAIEIPYEQKMNALPYDNELRMAACIGLGYMNYSALCDFTSYCIDVYRNHKEKVLPKYEAHQKYKLPGGICEMTLLYLWYKENPSQMSILNWGMPIEDTIPVAVVNEAGKTYCSEINLKTVNKKHCEECIDVRFEEGIPYGYDLDRIRVLSLHFGGKSKMFMDSFVNEKPYSGLAYVDWLYWEYRNMLSSTILGKMKRRIKKFDRSPAN